MRIPDKVSEKGLEPDLRRAFNQLVEYLRTIQPRDSSSVSVSTTTNGVTLAVKPSARGNGSGSVPRWG
jgi:molybdenum cofactor biosynthesis enzyme MoaA